MHAPRDASADEAALRRSTTLGTHPHPLTPAQLSHLARALRARQHELASESARSEHSLGLVRSARADGSNDDEHDPDGTPLSAEWSHLAGVNAGLVQRTAEVSAALERLASGTYGACIRCHRPVGFARLDALPAAAACIECAQQQ